MADFMPSWSQVYRDDFGFGLILSDSYIPHSIKLANGWESRLWRLEDKHLREGSSVRQFGRPRLLRIRHRRRRLNLSHFHLHQLIWGRRLFSFPMTLSNNCFFINIAYLILKSNKVFNRNIWKKCMNCSVPFRFNSASFHSY